MGFALWVDEDLAWAAGTSEYRAMGAAVVSRTDLFRPADFRGARRVPSVPALRYAGHFASLGQINAWLIEARRARVGRASVRPGRSAKRARGAEAQPHKAKASTPARH